MEHQDDEQRQSFSGHHIARKLNFSAPLLTTRRPAANAGCLSISPSGRRLSSTSDRVPFCWEQSPGKPKEYVDRCDHDDDGATATPRPTLPPGWWRPPIQTRRNSRHHHFNDHDCNDNIDDNDDNVDNSSGSGCALSDDVFSLSEAMDIVEKEEKAHKFSDELKLKQLKLLDDKEEEEEEERSNGNYNRSSNFMIERFLPDATALAASSVLSHHALSPPRRASRRPFSPPKGCGLDVLIPWRTKHHHQLCGVKSPVRDGGRRLRSKSSAKQKKQH